ncbi:hypothetical protein SY2F82_34110 [Streptomyces sp. Y2F8-2]|nr:hypothetical protein SY2F82_34110 [Streptomyces sp. Y2F8-2]
MAIEGGVAHARPSGDFIERGVQALFGEDLAGFVHQQLPVAQRIAAPHRRTLSHHLSLSSPRTGEFSPVRMLSSTDATGDYSPFRLRRT